jgi:septal ring factor EnvC (AmiA/AmiB activator)
MELKALRRLEGSVEELVGRLDKAADRQSQLSAALAKSREEVDRLKAEVARFRSERSVTKKKVDSLLKRFDTLDVDWGEAES